jgi:tRNA/rRNA methyltransferase
MKIRFILVEPAVPENVGAAARAVKTMGHSELILVNPQCQLDGKALWVAHASEEIVLNSKRFATLAEALEGSDFSVATTAKERKVKCDPVSSRELAAFLASRRSASDTVSVVFGREESGLTNEEVKLCDISTQVPMKQLYPSLNLAQAVMIYAYELSALSLDISGPEGTETDDVPLHLLKERTGKVLTNIEIPVTDARYGRIMERLSLLSPSDVRLLLTVTDKIIGSGPAARTGRRAEGAGK